MVLVGEGSSDVVEPLFAALDTEVFREIDSAQHKRPDLRTTASNSMRSAPSGAGTFGDLRQGPQGSVDRRRIRKQVGNFGVEDNNV
jgi:hypothetical protein